MIRDTGLSYNACGAIYIATHSVIASAERHNELHVCRLGHVTPVRHVGW